MLLEQTHEKMIAMKLYGMAGSLKERLERADHQSLSKEEFSGCSSMTSGCIARIASSPLGCESPSSKSVTPRSKTSTIARRGAYTRPRYSSSRRTAGSMHISRS
jgi:hypothetical protein